MKMNVAKHSLAIAGIILPIVVFKNHPNITLVDPAITAFHFMIDIPPLGIWLLKALLAVTLGSLAGLASRAYALVFRAIMLAIAVLEAIALLSWPYIWGWLQLYPPVLGILLETIILRRRYPPLEIGNAHAKISQ
jgi:hypothetical protein